jgi:hypothetical protein
MAEIEDALRAGQPDVPGLCRALSDWAGELRLLEHTWQARRFLRMRVAQGMAPVAPQSAHVRAARGGWPCRSLSNLQTQNARRGLGRAGVWGRLPDYL